MGGSGDAEEDFGKLTGGSGQNASESGHQIGANGVRLRYTDKGPRIDIPANGDKPHETLHYPTTSGQQNSVSNTGSSGS